MKIIGIEIINENCQELDYSLSSIFQSSAWFCQEEFLKDYEVAICIGYLDRHNDFELLWNLLQRNKEDILTGYFDVKNEIEYFPMFAIDFVANEYAWELSKDFCKKRGYELPDYLFFKIRINL